MGLRLTRLCVHILRGPYLAEADLHPDPRPGRRTRSRNSSAMPVVAPATAPAHDEPRVPVRPTVQPNVLSTIHHQARWTCQRSINNRVVAQLTAPMEASVASAGNRVTHGHPVPRYWHSVARRAGLFDSESATYPFTAPANRPRTKKRCRLKKTIIGRMIETNAAAVSRCQPAPNELTMLLIW
jgi:hypothetical protein